MWDKMHLLIINTIQNWCGG